MQVNVVIDYTNHRGERDRRIVAPITIAYANNQWHTEDQWLLIAMDVEKNKLRYFAMKDIHSWQPFE